MPVLQLELLFRIVAVERLDPGRATVHEGDKRGEDGPHQGPEKSLFRPEAAAGLMSFDLIQEQDIRASPILKGAHQSQAGQQVADDDRRFADFDDIFPTYRTCLFLLEPGHNAFPTKGMATGCYHSFAEDAVADGARQLLLQKDRQVREATGVVTHPIAWQGIAIRRQRH